MNCTLLVFPKFLNERERVRIGSKRQWRCLNALDEPQKEKTSPPTLAGTIRGAFFKERRPEKTRTQAADRKKAKATTSYPSL